MRQRQLPHAWWPGGGQHRGWGGRPPGGGGGVVLGGGGGAGGRGSGRMLGDQEGNSIAAEAAASAGGEENVAGVTAAFGQPGAQDGDGAGRQRGAAVFPAFAVTAHVGTVAELDVGSRERGELADAQAGVQEDE